MRRLRIACCTVPETQTGETISFIDLSDGWRSAMNFDEWWAIADGIVMVGRCWVCIATSSNQIFIVHKPFDSVTKLFNISPQNISFILIQKWHDSISPKKKLSTSHASERKTNDLLDNNQAWPSARSSINIPNSIIADVKLDMREINQRERQGAEEN